MNGHALHEPRVAVILRLANLAADGLAPTLWPTPLVFRLKKKPVEALRHNPHDELPTPPRRAQR